MRARRHDDGLYAKADLTPGEYLAVCFVTVERRPRDRGMTRELTIG